MSYNLFTVKNEIQVRTSSLNYCWCKFRFYSKVQNQSKLPHFTLLARNYGEFLINSHKRAPISRWAYKSPLGPKCTFWWRWGRFDNCTPPVKHIWRSNRRINSCRKIVLNFWKDSNRPFDILSAAGIYCENFMVPRNFCMPTLINN